MRLLLVLAETPEPAARPRREFRDRQEPEGGDYPDPDDLFREQPVLRHVVEPEDEQDFFDV